MAVNRQNALTVSVTAGALVNFALNLVLIPMFMSLGAAIASITAEICVTVVQFWFVRKVFSFVEALALCKKYFLCSVCMMAAIVCTDELLQYETGVINTSILGAVGICVYVFLLWIMKDDLLRWGLEKLKNRLKMC